MKNSIHPDPNVIFPIEGWTKTCFLKNIITNPQIIVGDYTYYDDQDNVYNFEKNVLYLFDFVDEKLIIGKFCQIATGVRFIMNGGNHAMDGASTYPFQVFRKSWEKAPMNPINKGNTVIGNDVWIGNSVTIMQGIKIGHGAIIGTNALVTKDVEPYTVVGGNPAKVIRKRFDDETIAFLLELAWWDWPIDIISEHVVAITTGDFDVLRAIHHSS
jgi:virginiamycin A acetyltransferase